MCRLLPLEQIRFHEFILLFVLVQVKPFAVFFSYDIVVSVKKSKQISLLKQQCCKKIRRQTVQDFRLMR